MRSSQATSTLSLHGVVSSTPSSGLPFHAVDLVLEARLTVADRNPRVPHEALEPGQGLGLVASRSAIDRS